MTNESNQQLEARFVCGAVIEEKWIKECGWRVATAQVYLQVLVVVLGINLMMEAFDGAIGAVMMFVAWVSSSLVYIERMKGFVTKYIKQEMKKIHTVTYFCTEECIYAMRYDAEENWVACRQYEYRLFRRAYESENLLILYGNQEKDIVLYFCKDSFEKGTPQACYRFLTQKIKENRQRGFRKNT